MTYTTRLQVTEDCKDVWPFVDPLLSVALRYIIIIIIIIIIILY